MDFEWDFSKELENIRKHRVTFAEAVECFIDPRGVQLVDIQHSSHERRFYWVGRAKSGRVLTTWFTQRGERVRIIGCAEWRKFRRFYEAAQDDESAD
jgi:uncharacterized protein